MLEVRHQSRYRVGRNAQITSATRNPRNQAANIASRLVKVGRQVPIVHGLKLITSRNRRRAHVCTPIPGASATRTDVRLANVVAITSDAIPDCTVGLLTTELSGRPRPKDTGRVGNRKWQFIHGRPAPTHVRWRIQCFPQVSVGRAPLPDGTVPSRQYWASRSATMLENLCA
jgi:hypothetical protein